jgi:hypothetical protein
MTLILRIDADTFRFLSALIRWIRVISDLLTRPLLQTSKFESRGLFISISGD